MSWKERFVIGLTVASSWLGAKANETPAKEGNDSVKIENTQNNLQPEHLIVNDVNQQNDSIATDTLMTQLTPEDEVSTPKDSIIADTVCISPNLQKFRDAEYDMMCLIAHCEGVKTNAYWDPYGRKWTIGFGNTIRPDGKPVHLGDKIKSEDELKLYFNAHVENYIFSDMDKYLDMDKMSKEEIVALGSFLYNCGSGCLRSYNKAEKKLGPSNFAKNLNEFFETHSAEAKAKVSMFMNKKVVSGGKTLPQLVKRRDLEKRILFGDITLSNKGMMAEGTSLDFSEIPLGGIYSIGSHLPVDTVDLCNRLRGVSYGKNLPDSLQTAFNKNASKTTLRIKANSNSR